MLRWGGIKSTRFNWEGEQTSKKVTMINTELKVVCFLLCRQVEKEKQLSSYSTSRNNRGHVLLINSPEMKGTPAVITAVDTEQRDYLV